MPWSREGDDSIVVTVVVEDELDAGAVSRRAQ